MENANNGGMNLCVMIMIWNGMLKGINKKKYKKMVKITDYGKASEYEINYKHGGLSLFETIAAPDVLSAIAKFYKLIGYYDILKIEWLYD
jgi:hypothetical protein